MTSKRKRNIKWFLIILCCILFILCMEHVFKTETISFDSAVYHFIHEFESPFVTVLLKIITEFGNLIAFLGITTAAVLLLHNRKYLTLILGNLGVVIVLNQLLKLIFLRPRPLDIALIKETGYSFPSGHAMASVAFYGFLIYILWQTKQEKSVKVIVSIILSVLVLLIGISRIYLGVHYASDVLAGYSISVIYLIIMTRLSKKYL